MHSTVGYSFYADLSSLTCLTLEYMRGAVLPPEGQYLSRLRSLRVETFNEVGTGLDALVL